VPDRHEVHRHWPSADAPPLRRPVRGYAVDVARLADEANIASAVGRVGLAELGCALLEEVSGIVERFEWGLRADPASFPGVERLSDVQLRDHTSSWLADVAQVLVTLESASDPSELVRDGTEIQRVISERHGAQRYHLDWGEAALSCEFQALHGAIDEALAARGVLERVAPEAQAVVAGFVRQAEQTALRGLRHAARTAPV
jgi:hypothetical protein